jgi:hypothetical protein
MNLHNSNNNNTCKEYQATMYGQAVVRSKAKRAREKDISLNARKENRKRLRQGQLEQITGAKMEAVQMPSRRTGGAASTEIERKGNASRGKHWRRYKRRLTGSIASVSCKGF